MQQGHSSDLDTGPILPIYDKDVEGEHVIESFETDMNSLRDAVMDNIPVHNEPYMYHDDNSPLTLSAENSDNDDDNSDNGSFHKLTDGDIEQTLEKYYQQDDSLSSNELDALITFVKGQKHLYLQSKNYIQKRLHLFVLPTICISGFIAMFSSFIRDYEWSEGAIAGLNGIIAILVALTSYFKLESGAHSYYLSAYQYDKLETGLEFVASRIAFIHDQEEAEKIILEKIQETEQKINEMKDWNHLFVPNKMQTIFPLICHMNIFSFIKRLETNKRSTLKRFRNVKNEIRFICHQFDNHAKTLTLQERTRLERRIQVLIQTKESIKVDLRCYRNAYSYLDDLFTCEIQCAEKNAASICRTVPCREKTGDNHIVDQLLKGIGGSTIPLTKVES
tara:strand:- start:1081 stop:2253 length:1173 start_codon:yes stop_codon:yes gene_type:complete